MAECACCHGVDGHVKVEVTGGKMVTCPNELIEKGAFIRVKG